MLRLPLLALLVCFAGAPVAAVQGPDGDALLNDALAVLRVNDLQWLERQAAGYAAAAGIDPTGTRGQVAQWLFRAKGLDGIDLNRPALVAWRPGKAPLVAVIPLLDRPRFMAGFGQVSRFGPPLIRVGERDGTTVFSQNTPRGLVEYRLLVQNDTAYLAATVDDCRALAAKPLVRTGQHAPVEMTCRPGFFALHSDDWPEIGAPAIPFSLDPHLVALMTRFGSGARNEILAQVATITLEARPLGDIGVVIDGRIQARADTALAQMVSLQKNQGSRLLPILRNANTVMTMHGAIAWQGQLDRIGQQIAADAQGVLGDGWTRSVEDAWRESWAARDRNGAFAVAWDVYPSGKPGSGHIVISTAVEQAQAGPQVARSRQLAEAMVPLFDAPFADAAKPHHSFEEMSVSGLLGYRHLVSGVSRQGPFAVDLVELATGSHVVSVETSSATAGQRMSELVPRMLLEASQKPEGTAALVAVRFDPAVEARLIHGEAIGRLEPAPIEAWAKATPQGDLLVHLELPLIPLAVVDRESRSAAQRPEPAPAP